MLLALMVMPRSRSRSMESSTCSCISRCDNAPVISSRRSARVDLPWSICAMIQKLRMNFGSIYLMTGRDSLFVMSHAARIAPCNHSVCHKQSEAVDTRGSIQTKKKINTELAEVGHRGRREEAREIG